MGGRMNQYKLLVTYDGYYVEKTLQNPEHLEKISK